jgi:hypothetical protein
MSAQLHTRHTVFSNLTVEKAVVNTDARVEASDLDTRTRFHGVFTIQVDSLEHEVRS